MNKEQVQQHKEVIKWFLDNPDKGVWARKDHETKWELVFEPTWIIGAIFVQNDEYAHFRKAMADGKTVLYKNVQYDISKSLGEWLPLEKISISIPLKHMKLAKPPKFFLNKINQAIIKFDHLTDFGRKVYGDGVYQLTEKEVKKSKEWMQIDDPTILKDKDIVICWDNNIKCSRNIRFYDAKNDCTFHQNGERGGYSYDNYRKVLPIYEYLYFNNIDEIRKSLED